MFEYKLSVLKTCQRKVILLSEALSHLREKKVFCFKILAPGTLKENTRDCYFPMGLRSGEKVELCYKETTTRLQHCLFYLNHVGIIHRIKTLSLSGCGSTSNSPIGMDSFNWKKIHYWKRRHG